MKNRDRKSNSQKDMEPLIAEAFECAQRTLNAFERLATAVLSLSLEKTEACSIVEVATSAPKIEDRDEILLCTIKEACKRTGLSRSSIYKAIGSGELPAKKLGQRTLIELDEIRKWIASSPSIASRRAN